MNLRMENMSFKFEKKLHIEVIMIVYIYRLTEAGRTAKIWEVGDLRYKGVGGR